VKGGARRKKEDNGKTEQQCVQKHVGEDGSRSEERGRKDER
jgi:hypothetical protein